MKKASLKALTTIRKPQRAVKTITGQPSLKEQPSLLKLNRGVQVKVRH